MVVIARSSIPGRGLEAIRHRVRALDKDLALSSVATLEDVISDSLRSPRLLTRLIGVFASVAVILAAIGLYGVLAYAVVQRRREIGIRMALGATTGNIIQMIVLGVCKLVLFGLGIGAVGALLGSAALKSFLFGVSGSDPYVLGTVVTGVAIVAIVATYVPAVRASKVDPVVSLRYD
jgi:ABC-type antimicrobial peptide transport system permease subunit